MNALANYNLNFNAVGTGISSLAILTTGLIIFLQNTKSAINRFFLFTCLSLFVWLSGFSMVYMSKEAAVALTWYKYYSHLGVVAIAQCFYFFSRAVTRNLKNPTPWFILSIFLTLIFYLLGFSHNFIVGAVRFPWGWYPRFGALSYCFLACFLLFMALSIIEFWLALGKSESKIENKKIIILLIGTLIGYTGSLDFLPAFGIAFCPFGYVSVFIWISLVGYAVLKYKLMLITPAVAAEQIISLIPDFLILADPGGKITRVNRAVKEVLGYGQDELFGRDVDIVFAEKTAADSLENDLIMKGAVRNFKTTFQQKDGKRIPVISSASIVRNAIGDIQGFVFTALDITELMRSEEELQAAYEQLKATNAQLVQSTKMASMGILAGGVAHEINNPLTGILSNVQLVTLLAQHKEDFNLADFKDILKDIESSSMRCVNITQSLLNFSRTSKGIVEAISLNDAVEDIIPLIENELKLQSVMLRTDLKSDLPLMQGDIQLVEQVIFDMINNARWAIKKRTDTHAGEITVKTDFEPDKKNVSVSISDTGIGIPQESLAKIFDPFFTTKEPGEGTGLGLSIAYNIVKSHQGTIEVKSEVGVGTTFKLLFPSL